MVLVEGLDVPLQLLAAPQDALRIAHHRTIRLVNLAHSIAHGLCSPSMARQLRDVDRCDFVDLHHLHPWPLRHFVDLPPLGLQLDLENERPGQSSKLVDLGSDCKPTRMLVLFTSVQKECWGVILTLDNAVTQLFVCASHLQRSVPEPDSGRSLLVTP